MKKLIFIKIVAVAALVFTSCEKDSDFTDSTSESLTLSAKASGPLVNKAQLADLAEEAGIELSQEARNLGAISVRELIARVPLVKIRFNDFFFNTFRFREKRPLVFAERAKIADQLGVTLFNNDAFSPADTPVPDSNGDTTGGDSTVGDTTGGDTTEGDTTEGEATEGEATEGEATEGEATGTVVTRDQLADLAEAAGIQLSQEARNLGAISVRELLTRIPVVKIRFNDFFFNTFRFRERRPLILAERAKIAEQLGVTISNNNFSRF